MLKPISALCVSLSIASPVVSKPLNIVTDIAPIHSLVSQISGKTNAITLLLDSGASPHDYALKPSHAKALQSADLVIFTGLELTPWLEKPLNTLSHDSEKLALMASTDTILHEMRDDNVFTDDHYGHDHGDHHSDPHGWMDPQNAKNWLNHITEKLSYIDPKNSEKYNKNNIEAQESLTQLINDVSAQLGEHDDQQVIFFHDAYQYFEQRFQIRAVGSVTLADDAKVTPKQLRAIESLFKNNDVRCVLTEPATKEDWVNNLAGGSVAQASIDPLGATITLGPNFYGEMIRSTADQIAKCLRAT